MQIKPTIKSPEQLNLKISILSSAGKDLQEQGGFSPGESNTKKHFGKQLASSYKANCILAKELQGIMEHDNNLHLVIMLRYTFSRLTEFYT